MAGNPTLDLRPSLRPNKLVVFWPIKLFFSIISVCLSSLGSFNQIPLSEEGHSTMNKVKLPVVLHLPQDS